MNPLSQTFPQKMGTIRRTIETKKRAIQAKKQK
jgi:hypothetical protein